MGRILNPKPVTLESVEPSISCLVLLGEPGIGKSKELEKQKQLTQSRISESADDVLFFELGIYGSTDLRKEVFENSTIENWSRGTNNLYLFLDSLDEGRLAVNALTRLLANKLKDLPRDRLRLRITCRTAEWQSSSFEDELVTLFGSDAVKVFELHPLCRSDAEGAAEQNGLDPRRFMTEVADNDVEAFASKPVTVNLLIKFFKRHNTLPKTQSELYLEGCRALCDDTDKRKEARRTGTLDPDQRLILAARIAAITIFGSRSTISVGRDATDADDDVDIILRDLTGETESCAGETFRANQSAVREVLEYTGLFTSGGQHRLRWAHQTYAEFLAAHYLCRHNMTLSQKLDLILHHGDPE